VSSGLAFHPTRPLLAASLHNGSVQLWNYQMGTLVDRFEEHDGMGVLTSHVCGTSSLHLTQGRCEASLFIRHVPYLRPEEMTIKSKFGVCLYIDIAGIRLNGCIDLRPQSRRCIFTLHGHMDYVRTVQFHHEMPWIVRGISSYYFVHTCTNVIYSSPLRTTKRFEFGTVLPGIA